MTDSDGIQKGLGNRRRACGFTLIELLVVISIIAVLMSVLMPALSGAKNEGHKAKCIANMANLCKAGAGYAMDHSDTGAMLAMPAWWRNIDDSGFYDYGGGNGEEDGQGAWGFQEGGNRDAGIRPLNRFIYGPGVSGRDDFSQFQCPGDFGWVDAPFYATDSWRSEWKIRPFWQSTGTSYRANAARAGDDVTTYSMSPYARPVTRIPAPSETLLYSETIHWLARWNTASASEDPESPTGQPPATIPGWHGKMGRFNIGFVDGHASTIMMDKDGMDPGLGYGHPLDPELSQLWTRGPGPQRWRIDTRREPLIPIE